MDKTTWRMRWNFYWYRRGPHVQDARTRQTMSDLYTDGLLFLYGLLFRRTFRNKAAEDNPTGFEHNNDTFTTTVAVHVRHPSKFDNGTDVSHELACLQRLLRKSVQGKCAVYIMSDRQATLDLVGAYVLKRGCRNATVPAHVKGTLEKGTFGWKAEHGDYGRAVRCLSVVVALACRT